MLPGQEGPLVEVLAAVLGEDASQAHERIARGSVWVDGRRARVATVVLRAGQILTVVLEEAGADVLAPPTPPPPLAVVYRDEACIAVAKPSGINAQATPGRVDENLLGEVSRLLGHPAGLVHRLDRETSGVTVFGITKQDTSALAAAFREGTAHKRYLAVCGPALEGHGQGGRVDLPLSRDPSRPGRFRASRKAHGVSAVTDWSLLHAGADHALVALFPRTGRTHQLRAHLTALEAPICGDARYGGARMVAGQAAERCLLHAQALLLPHPRTGKPLLLEAPLPEDVERVFREDGVTPPSGAWDVEAVGLSVSV